MSDLVAEAPEGTGLGGTRALDSCVNVFNDITAEDFDPMSFAVDGVVAGMDLKFAGLKPSQFNFSDISGRYKNMADGIDWSPTNPMDSNRFGDAVQAADVGGGYPVTGIKAALGESDNQDDAYERAAEDQ